MITLQGVEVDNVESSAALDVTSMAALDGKTSTLVTGSLLTSVENLRKYGFRSTASNHSLLLIGKVNLITLFIIYTLAGRR